MEAIRILNRLEEQDSIIKNKMEFNKKLKRHKDLCEYLCDTMEEKREFQKIYNSYDNEYDIITEYIKNRNKRGTHQYTVDELRDIIDTQDSIILKDSLQRMFSNFIDDEDINDLLIKSKKRTSIIDDVVSKHKNYKLESLHNLLLIIE